MASVTPLTVDVYLNGCRPFSKPESQLIGANWVQNLSTPLEYSLMYLKIVDALRKRVARISKS